LDKLVHPEESWCVKIVLFAIFGFSANLELALIVPSAKNSRFTESGDPGRFQEIQQVRHGIFIFAEI
jgi:hypothetical protein